MLSLLRRRVLDLAAAMGAAGIGVFVWAGLTADGEPGFHPGPSAHRLASPKHVVLISIDTLRADRLGVYGHAEARTPNIDALGRSGVLFLQATVPIPRTTPALASLMTGVEPRTHGSTEVGEPMDDLPVLAETLRNAGFQTIGVSANGAAGRRQGFARGFDHFVDREITAGGERGVQKVGSAVTDSVAQLVERIDPSRPVFLWAHYVDPHWPYSPPRRFKDQPAAPACRQLARIVRDKNLTRGNLVVNTDSFAERARSDCSDLYDAEVAYTDLQVGKLVDVLDELGILDETLIVLTADHGENLGEDNYYYDHGPSLHDSSLRVPLILSGAGVPQGKLDDEVTLLQDLAPSIFELVGVPVQHRPGVDGQSLAWRWDPQFAPPRAPAQVALAESASALLVDSHTFLVSGRRGGRWCVNGERYSLCATPGSENGSFFDHLSDPRLERAVPRPTAEEAALLDQAARLWGPEEARSRCARSPDFKLVQYPLATGGHREVLYDLRADPGETRNVIDQNPRVAQRLRTALETWSAEPLAPREHVRSDEELDSLRALGYIQ